MSRNQLTSLPDLSRNTALVSLNVGGNPLSNLDGLAVTDDAGYPAVVHQATDTYYLAFVASDVASVQVTPTAADAGVTVSPRAMTVAEDGGAGTYTVVLRTRPTGDVTVTPSSSAVSTATVSAPLTFTPSNWDTPQAVTVTVTGLDDDIDNAEDRKATVSHAVSGGGYGGVAAVDVSVTVTDDDIAGITIDPDSVTVGEDGGTAAHSGRTLWWAWPLWACARR